MKILEIGNADSVFMFEYLKRLKSARPDYDIELLDLGGDGSRYDYTFLKLTEIHRLAGMDVLKRIPLLRSARLIVLLRRKLLRLGAYNYVHVHYVMPCLGAVGRRLSGRGRLILTFWGTDLLNGGKISAKFQRRLLKKAFRVTYYTAYMDKCFKEKFGGRYTGITRNINFGINALEAIDCVKTQYTRAQIKESLGLPADSVIVCCGSNGYSTQQHEKIIAALGQLRPEYVERVFFYLHMAYGGGRAYRAKIKRLFAASGLDGRVDTAYMYMEDVARLRLAADIFILMQERDALSTALMEHMYAGSVPIVGSWLVYRELAGCLMHTAGSVRDITAQLAGIIDNIGEEKGRCAANKELIKNIGSWDESVGRWIRLYEQRETPDMLWNAQ